MKFRVFVLLLPVIAALGACASNPSSQSKVAAEDKEETVEVTGSLIPKKVSKSTDQSVQSISGDDAVNFIRQNPTSLPPSKGN